MRRKFVLIILFTLLFTALNPLILAEPPIIRITKFSDDTPTKVISFPSGGGTDLSAGLEFPKKAVVTNATFNVSTVRDINGYYPTNPSIDVGGDGDYEWAYQGKGYGQFGRQAVFSDDNLAQIFYFDGKTTYQNHSTFYLPKNAVVDSAKMTVRSYGPGNVIVVTNGANSYGVNLIRDALESVGNNVTVTYETKLPTNWSDPDSYKAIFWIGGVANFDGPMNSLLKPFVEYVQNGGHVLMCGQWIDYTGSYSGTYEIPFFTWVMHHTWGNRWSGGGSGSGGTKYTHQSVTTHPVFNSPHKLPKYWNNTYTGTFWYNPIATINNGNIIGLVDSTTTKPRYNGIISWNGSKYDQVYGSTLLVRQPIARSWFNITDGDVLSNFTRNVANWFLGMNKPMNVTVNIGDNGGLPEFSHSGVLNGSGNIADFSTELNSLIASSPIAFTDEYGTQFIEVPVNITNDNAGRVKLVNLDIRYNLTTTVFSNPHNVNLSTELNELIPDTGEGNITIPFHIYSGTVGKLNVSNLTIDYYIPELTNDVLFLTNGYGPAKTCYADYENYTFTVRITNVAGINDVNDVTLILDADGEQLQINWTRATQTFHEVYDPKNLITLDNPNCNSTPLGADRWSLNFTVRFAWAYPNETMEVCALNTTNNSGAWVFNYFENVYSVENDLDFVGNLEVSSQYQGVMKDGDWVRASEELYWSNLTVVYEGTSDFYPDNKNFNITIYDNDKDYWVNSTSSGSPFTLKTQADAATDIEDTHTINITDIPGTGVDISKVSFIVRVDADGPTAPANIWCQADSNTSAEDDYDDDTEIFVSWSPASDIPGSGVELYAMDYNKPIPTTIRRSGDPDIGQEGVCTFYVRARDNVGNWGSVGSASITIDLTDIIFTQSFPDPEVWQTSRNVDCGVLIQDLTGSGVNNNTIYYKYVEKGSIETGTWHRYRDAPASGETILCSQNITFDSDGIQKKIRWRASDLAGNELIDPNYYTLKIDSTPVTFDDFTMNFNDWHRTLKPEISFSVKDLKPPNDESSGVDTNSIKYQISTSGMSHYGAWVPVVPVSSAEGVSCTIQPTFIEGDQNYIRFSGKDIAGNEFITPGYQVKIDTSVPEFNNPTPEASFWSNSTTIQCSIAISDEHSKVDVESVRYSISTNGTEHYSKWRKIGIKHLTESSYHHVTLNINDTFKEGENNYIHWWAFDVAGNNVTSDDYLIRVDVQGCTFQEPMPEPETWENSDTVVCSIIINDTFGSGINTSSIEYMTSDQGLVFSGNWKNKDVQIDELTATVDNNAGSGDQENGYGHGPYLVKASVAVYIFNEGVNNYIIWRAKDIARNQYQVGGPYQVKLDFSPLGFYDPTPDPKIIQFELEITCKITVKDDENGSGVNSNSVEYRYSTTGKNGYSAWSSYSLSQVKLTNGFNFIVFINFNAGSENYIQWRAMDNAGNGPFESPEYKIMINSPPEPVISSPSHSPSKDYDYTTEDEITFNARKTTDPDGVDELSYYWESNLTGPIGYSQYFTYKLSPGMHKIILYVNDGHNHNASKHVNITVVRYKDVKDTDSDGTPDYLDPDIDNDGVMNEDDMFPENKREWLDTDLDGIGNNADLDDDGDEYPDDEDKYPLDKSRWKEEVEDVGWIYLTAVIIILIIILVLGFIIVKRTSKKKKAEEAAAEPAAMEPTVDVTKPTLAGAGVGVSGPGVGPMGAPPLMPYQRTMPIHPMHPYQFPPMKMGGPVQGSGMAPQTLYMPMPGNMPMFPFPMLPPKPGQAPGTFRPPMQQQQLQQQPQSKSNHTPATSTEPSDMKQTPPSHLKPITPEDSTDKGANQQNK
ncbi:thrombospondin type 3 repeat-containing protein [[Eubacterium] cellulosolvens]